MAYSSQDCKNHPARSFTKYLTLPMLRQSELFRVLGRRLTERLIKAGWITLVRNGGAIEFDDYEVHRALKRLAREGYLLGPRVVTSAEKRPAKVQRTRESLEDALSGDLAQEALDASF